MVLLEERAAAQLIVDLSDAIQYGHDRGIIHRDLKPQNILLKPNASNPNGFVPVVLDFGLCGLVDTGHTSTSMLGGTPRYMSPEQAMFGRRPITKKTDIYSLGVILYQLLTGHLPHQPLSISEAVLMLHSSPIESPRRLRPGLSPALECICLKCLRKDQDRRYESAHALASDLRSYLEGMSSRLDPRASGKGSILPFVLVNGKVGWAMQ